MKCVTMILGMTLMEVSCESALELVYIQYII